MMNGDLGTRIRKSRKGPGSGRGNFERQLGRAKNNGNDKKWMKSDGLFKQKVGYRECPAKWGRENG
jgi:hypothetical protein